MGIELHRQVLTLVEVQNGQVMNYSLEGHAPVPFGSVLWEKGNGEGRRLF